MLPCSAGAEECTQDMLLLLLGHVAFVISQEEERWRRATEDVRGQWRDSSFCLRITALLLEQQCKNSAAILQNPAGGEDALCLGSS